MFPESVGQEAPWWAGLTILEYVCTCVAARVEKDSIREGVKTRHERKALPEEVSFELVYGRARVPDTHQSHREAKPETEYPCPFDALQ